MPSKLTPSETLPSNGPIVIKITGAALEGPSEAAQVASAIASVYRAWSSGVVVVHGGGKAVDAHLAKLGIVSEKRNGIRITPGEHIDEIVAVLAGKMNKRLVGQLQASGLAAVGFCLGDGFLVRSIKAAHALFDPGHVGRMVGGDPLLVQTLLPAGFVPVISSIGLDSAGQPLNVNADDAAADLARLLGASALFFLTDVAGVQAADGSILDSLDTARIEHLIATQVISGGMVAKVRSALAAANESRAPVHIMSWRQSLGSLNGAGPSWPGTRIVPNIAAEAASSNGSNGIAGHGVATAGPQLARASQLPSNTPPMVTDSSSDS